MTITYPELGLVAVAFLVLGIAIGYGWCLSLWTKHSEEATHG